MLKDANTEIPNAKKTCVQSTKSAIISRVLVGSPPRKHTSSAVQVRGSGMQYVPVYYTIGLFRCFTNQTTSAMQAATVGPCGCWPRNHQIQLLDYALGQQRKSTQESPDTTCSLNYSGLWVGSEEGVLNLIIILHIDNAKDDDCWLKVVRQQLEWIGHCLTQALLLCYSNTVLYQIPDTTVPI